MPAALFTLFATTVTLSVPAGGAADCPSAAQLTEALNTHVPGLVSPTSATPTPGPTSPTGSTALRLAVTTLSGGDVRFELVDAQGEALLHRVLPAPPRGHEPDCPALAETVALVVERYLHDVGYEAPPLSPPPPRAPPAPTMTLAPAAPPTIAGAAPAPVERTRVVVRLGLAAQGRLGDAGGLDGDGDLAVSVEGAGPRRQLAARLSVGVAPPDDARWSETPPPKTTTATLERLPIRLGVYLRLPLSVGQLEPGVAGPGIASEHHLAPFFDLALGYTVSLAGPVYVRGLSRAALAVPYDFNTLHNGRVWGTPRVFGELGVEFGFQFR